MLTILLRGKKWELDIIFLLSIQQGLFRPQFCLQSLYKFNTHAHMHTNKKNIGKEFMQIIIAIILLVFSPLPLEFGFISSYITVTAKNNILKTFHQAHFCKTLTSPNHFWFMIKQRKRVVFYHNLLFFSNRSIE